MKKRENDRWLKFENWSLEISELSSITPISIQLLIRDLVFPVYKIDCEKSEKTFLRNV
jgi:hypothetical protein